MALELQNTKAEADRPPRDLVDIMANLDEVLARIQDQLDSMKKSLLIRRSDTHRPEEKINERRQSTSQFNQNARPEREGTSPGKS